MLANQFSTQSELMREIKICVEFHSAVGISVIKIILSNK